MVNISTPSNSPTRLRRPAAAAPANQPWWNPQLGSSMPYTRYTRPMGPIVAPESRIWPTCTIDAAPLWSSVDLRDGNQSLPNPMDPERKALMFDLLVEIGFKDIEVGYPSASQADFDFVRRLIEEDRVPDDVTIGVFTPARPELIDRTFEAIRGADRAVVHLCNATACLWREVVFGMTAAEVLAMAESSARHMMRLGDKFGADRVRFEYSPETFNVTEPEFALEVSNSVSAIVEATPDRPLILNLPTTVETDSPNVFADQVEWMHRNLDNRESIVLSVHPHNDRGTAVASAELALMSGADRVEGTLFGNGERTGNVCLATLAMNLFSRGVDPQLDFSDIDEVRTTVEYCNQMRVHDRHPYVGNLVYTAFSGTHQDAISKGMSALERRAAADGATALAWAVPYLPIDPKDVGRNYESVVRLNSQSGKGGVAHVLKAQYGLDLPRPLRRDFADAVQRVVDTTGVELGPQQLWDAFLNEYLELRSPFLFKEFHVERDPGSVAVVVTVADADGGEIEFRGTGADVSHALVEGLRNAGHHVALESISTGVIVDSRGEGEETVAYCELVVGKGRAFGVGLDNSPESAMLRSVICAANRALRA